MLLYSPLHDAMVGPENGWANPVRIWNPSGLRPGGSNNTKDKFGHIVIDSTSTRTAIL